jgi:hypothetical protein
VDTLVEINQITHSLRSFQLVGTAPLTAIGPPRAGAEVASEPRHLEPERLLWPLPSQEGRGFRICSDSPNIEVSGEKKKDKAAKVATARNLWVPAVNNHGGLGRWAFVEISAPWDAEGTIRESIRR